MQQTSSPIRVLHLLDTRAFAGTERHVLTLATALADKGIDSQIACAAGGALHHAADRLRVPIVPIRGSFLGPAGLRAVRRAVGDVNATVLHAHNGRSTLAAILAAGGRSRVVTTQHFIDPARVDRKGLAGVASRLVHRWIEARVDRIIAISEACKSAILGRGGPGADRVTVVRNGIAPPDASALRDFQTIRHEFGIAADQLVVICVARLEPEKDVDILIEAIADLRRRGRRLVCLVAGDGSERGRLEAKIRANRLDEDLRLLGFRPEALSLIAAADLLVLPSRAEPFGLVILEAMALAKPVIAVAAGGPPELVEAGKTGLLVPPRDAGALAGAIESLGQDVGLRLRMGKAGQATFASQFTASRMAAGMAAVYREVCQTRSAIAVAARFPEDLRAKGTAHARG